MPFCFCLQSAFICVYVSCIDFRHVMYSFTCYSNRSSYLIPSGETNVGEAQAQTSNLVIVILSEDGPPTSQPN